MKGLANMVANDAFNRKITLNTSFRSRCSITYWGWKYVFGVRQNTKTRVRGGSITYWGWKYVFGVRQNKKTRVRGGSITYWIRKYVFSVKQNAKTRVRDDSITLVLEICVQVRLKSTPKLTTPWHSQSR